jgi:hypothetical protein
VIGLRDRALIGIMVYSSGRVSAIIKMRVCDYFSKGKRFFIRLHEKGGKYHKETYAMQNEAIQQVEVFYSYSHKDEEFRDELEKHLSLLKRQGFISGWHDRKIGAGTEWKDSINEHLESAGIILLLVSSDFLASDYCYDIELKRAMERHENGEARVIPVILRHCDWSSAPFAKLQALPKNAKPITAWTDRDEAFTDVAAGLRLVITGLQRP